MFSFIQQTHNIMSMIVKNVSSVFNNSKLLKIPIKITRTKLTIRPKFIKISLDAKYSLLFLFICGRCEILNTLIEAIVRKNCADIVKHRL